MEISGVGDGGAGLAQAVAHQPLPPQVIYYQPIQHPGGDGQLHLNPPSTPSLPPRRQMPQIRDCDERIVELDTVSFYLPPSFVTYIIPFFRQMLRMKLLIFLFLDLQMLPSENAGLNLLRDKR